MNSAQAYLPLDDDQEDAVALMGNHSQIERGGIYTKSEVVDFILDLVGYDPTSDLTACRIIEPSCGAGDFLLPIVKRLLQSAARMGVPFSELKPCIRAVEIGADALAEARRKVEACLAENGASPSEIRALVTSWFCRADFLTTPFPLGFTHVVGNPPYIRQEELPSRLLSLYRSRFATMYDRADLYVAFFERALGLLEMGGKLGFICSDRWMKNKYGGPLRDLVSSRFHLEAHVDFTGCPAFLSDVVAYPAVTVISRTRGTETATSFRPEISAESLNALVPALRKTADHPEVIVANRVASGAEPWILDNFSRLAIVRKIEEKFPAISETGCKIGIGVATGSDRVYIGSAEKLDVEEVARLPLAMTSDISEGTLRWKGKYVLNPFHDDGTLLDLDTHPRLARYLKAHEPAILARNVARKNPTKWYRTIDRIYPSLTGEAKLLIPDIKGSANVVLDEGNFYPHHNLYFITSSEWDIRALQTILLSAVSQAFIATYSLKMRGDCLRFQAQYLRRLRLPLWRDVNSALQGKLIAAAENRYISEINILARETYGLNEMEWNALVAP